MNTKKENERRAQQKSDTFNKPVYLWYKNGQPQFTYKQPKSEFTEFIPEATRRIRDRMQLREDV